jgi:hypothetical protein
MSNTSCLGGVSRLTTDATGTHPNQLLDPPRSSPAQPPSSVQPRHRSSGLPVVSSDPSFRVSRPCRRRFRDTIPAPHCRHGKPTRAHRFADFNTRRDGVILPYALNHVTIEHSLRRTGSRGPVGGGTNYLPVAEHCWNAVRVDAHVTEQEWVSMQHFGTDD